MNWGYPYFWKHPNCTPPLRIFFFNVSTETGRVGLKDSSGEIMFDVLTGTQILAAQARPRYYVMIYPKSELVIDCMVGIRLKSEYVRYDGNVLQQQLETIKLYIISLTFLFHGFYS